MSFNKKFIKPLPEVKDEYFRLGHEQFVNLYKKADAFIGPSDSIDFIQDRFKGPYTKSILEVISEWFYELRGRILSKIST